MDQTPQVGTICLAPDQLREMLANAAEEGAKRTLARLGLDDEKAVQDLREARDLLSAYRAARRVAGETLIRLATTALFGALIAGLALHLIGGQGSAPPRQ